MTRGEVQAKLLEQVPAFAAEVQPLYQQLRWTWNMREVPSERDIQSLLQVLIEGLDEPYVKMRSGGLYAWWYQSEDEGANWGLGFELELLMTDSYMEGPLILGCGELKEGC